MSPISMRCKTIGAAAVALALLASPAAWAAGASDEKQDGAPLVVAQAPMTPARASSAGMAGDTFPAYQRGVRQAAAEGNEALRRYIWRTRMIYNFYYNDFAPRE